MQNQENISDVAKDILERIQRPTLTDENRASYISNNVECGVEWQLIYWIAPFFNDWYHYLHAAERILSTLGNITLENASCIVEQVQEFEWIDKEELIETLSDHIDGLPADALVSLDSDNDEIIQSKLHPVQQGTINVGISNFKSFEKTSIANGAYITDKSVFDNCTVANNITPLFGKRVDATIFENATIAPDVDLSNYKITVSTVVPQHIKNSLASSNVTVTVGKNMQIEKGATFTNNNVKVGLFM